MTCGQTHFLDERRDVGQRGRWRQYPVICAVDIVEEARGGSVTSDPRAVTCIDCHGRLNAAQVQPQLG